VDLEEALRDAEGRLEQAEAERQEITTRIGQLQEEVRGLQLALARHQGAPVASPTDNGWKTLARTDAIARVMREFHRPMKPVAIASALTERGRNTDKPAYVSAALAYLQKQGVVRRFDEGWMLVATLSEERGSG
jgi:hypothetical protein